MPITAQINPLSYLLRYQSGRQLQWGYEERKAFYDLAGTYYNNAAYRAVIDGGYRDYVLQEFGLDAASKLEGIYNPVQRVTDLYRYTLAGAWGKDKTIQLQPEGNGKAGLLPFMYQVWAWSNIGIERRALTTNAASLGTAGIRIVARNVPSKRVYLRFEHPGRIKEIELDDRGNVENVILEYSRMEGEFGKPEREVHTITEVLTPTEFITYRDGEKWDLVNERKNGPLHRYPNALGVTPYVLLRHIYTGDIWGLPAWHGQAGPIDNINVLASHVDEQIRRHVKAKWLVTAAGKAPKNVDLGDTTVAYVQLDPTTGQAPTMQPLVAPLSLADAIAAIEQRLEALRDNMPELKATDGKFLSGQSGETIAQLRLPAEELLFDARANYEDALVRAHKIAASWGITLGMLDLGTGSGKAAAQEAFEAGYEEHSFTERAGLPDDIFTKLKVEGIKQDNQNKIYTGLEILQRAGLLSTEQGLRDARPEWTEQQIQEELKRIEEAAEVASPEAGTEGNTDPLAGILGLPTGEGDTEAPEGLQAPPSGSE